MLYFSQTAASAPELKPKRFADFHLIQNAIDFGSADVTPTAQVRQIQQFVATILTAVQQIQRLYAASRLFEYLAGKFDL